MDFTIGWRQLSSVFYFIWLQDFENLKREKKWKEKNWNIFSCIHEKTICCRKRIYVLKHNCVEKGLI